MSHHQFFGVSLAADLNKIHDSWGWVYRAADRRGCSGATTSARTRKWSGFLLGFLTALSRGFPGYSLIRYPFRAEADLTMLLVFLFIVGGIFRTTGGSALHFPERGWAAASGIISLVLGILLVPEGRNLARA